MVALTVPGMAPLARREIETSLGAQVSTTGFDGRADVVLFDVPRGGVGETLRLRTTEDVLVEVAVASKENRDSARAVAERLWRPDGVERALSVWAEHVHPLARTMSYRAIVRVLDERSFRRKDLRLELNRAVGRDRPRWRTADPAQIEFWVLEYAPGRIVAGLRLSSLTMRQHGGRPAERHGALRPATAAAMVQLAGEPDGILLDPCCGSGTILNEARASGWTPRGTDIDPDAVKAARENVHGGAVEVGDARAVEMADASVGAWVSNLPFGHQFEIKGDPDEWLKAVLYEASRVTRPGGHVVLLAPKVSRKSVPPTLELIERVPIRLLGLK
ncbi:MAG: methyltransferase domain-containing protein, partial [Actinomycetota bacterium]